MTDAQAEKWITASALIVAGVYAYRRLTEGQGQPPVTAKKLAGVGQLPPLGPWATAWGVTYFVIALMATAAPELGAAFAILIATGDLLTNMQSVVKDVGASKGASSATAGSGVVDTPTGPGVGLGTNPFSLTPEGRLPGVGFTTGSGQVKTSPSGKPLPN